MAIFCQQNKSCQHCDYHWGKEDSVKATRIHCLQCHGPCQPKPKYSSSDVHHTHRYTLHTHKHAHTTYGLLYSTKTARVDVAFVPCSLKCCIWRQPETSIVVSCTTLILRLFVFDCFMPGKEVIVSDKSGYKPWPDPKN